MQKQKYDAMIGKKTFNPSSRQSSFNVLDSRVLGRVPNKNWKLHTHEEKEVK